MLWQQQIVREHAWPLPTNRMLLQDWSLEHKLMVYPNYVDLQRFDMRDLRDPVTQHQRLRDNVVSG